jgi:hypothetical protein
MNVSCKEVKIDRQHSYDQQTEGDGGGDRIWEEVMCWWVLMVMIIHNM